MRGESREILKKPLGHDLHKILKKCKEMGIMSMVPITKSQTKVINLLNGWYARKGFEYFEAQNLLENPKNLPPIADVQALAKHFIDNLKEPCAQVT